MSDHKYGPHQATGYPSAPDVAPPQHQETRQWALGGGCAISQPDVSRNIHTHSGCTAPAKHVSQLEAALGATEALLDHLKDRMNRLEDRLEGHLLPSVPAEQMKYPMPEESESTAIVRQVEGINDRIRGMARGADDILDRLEC